MVTAEILNGRTTLLEGRTCPIAFAQKLNWPKADCIIYSPSGKSQTHSIESLLDLRQEAYRLPHSASHLLLIIDQADKMPPLASQTLLKIFEEPPATTTFVLIAENRHKLLPTILSRCQVIKIGTEERKENPLKALILDFLSKGKFTSLFQLQESLEPLIPYFEDEEQRQENIALFFSTVLSWYRDKELESMIQSGQTVEMEKLFKAVKNAKLSFDRFTTPKQVLESLFISIGVLCQL